jgi:hypothetical protein
LTYAAFVTSRGRCGAGLATACLSLLLLAASDASATTGSIDGVTVAQDLSAASVQDLDVSYDECPSDAPPCEWTATATLRGPQDSVCPPEWSWLLGFEESPPGLPNPPPGWYPPRTVWNGAASGNTELQSGQLQLGLEGVNDRRLCLYATHFVAPRSYTEGEPPPPFQVTIPTSNLVAELLLHVNLPAATPPTIPETSSKRLHCRRGQKRITVHGRERCGKKHRGGHRRHRRQSH